MSTRVLVVDDDPAIRKAVSRALARGGFDVETASDVQPALAAAAVRRFDIVVVDFNMPTCGLEVVRNLKADLGAEVFVAVLTGEDTAEMRTSCQDAGADAMLIKPIAPAELCRRLTAAAVVLKTLAVAS